MILLPPARIRASYFDLVEKALNEFFLNLIYKPLARHVEIKNARDNALIAAIKSGRITLDGKEFSGSFNAKISAILKKMGAKFNVKKRIWTLEIVPPEYQLAQVHADARTAIMRDDILRVLDGATDNIETIFENIRLDDKYTWALRHANKDFMQLVKAVTVAPQLTERQERLIAEAYNKNMELYIKDFTESNILKLREKVRQSAYEGNRPSYLQELIQKNYGTTRNKAQFLARQETSLLMAKFHEQRYKDIGIAKYKWSSSHDARVRHDHKMLDGKIFTWDSPPVVDLSTGRRANPGEDFNCRCTAIPIWET